MEILLFIFLKNSCYFSLFFRIKAKYYQIWNFWNRCTKRGASSSLWHEMYWLRKWSYQNLGCYFSSNVKIKYNGNSLIAFYSLISNIQGVLNLWGIINLALGERIVAFKMLAISIIVFYSSFNRNPLPNGLWFRENIKTFSFERLYSENKAWNNL